MRKKELLAEIRLQAEKTHQRFPLLCIPKSTYQSEDFFFDRTFNARVKLARDELREKKLPSMRRTFYNTISPLCTGVIKIVKPFGFAATKGSQYSRICGETGSRHKNFSTRSFAISDSHCDYRGRVDAARNSGCALTDDEVQRICVLFDMDEVSVRESSRNKRTLRKYRKQLD